MSSSEVTSPTMTSTPFSLQLLISSALFSAVAFEVKKAIFSKEERALYSSSMMYFPIAPVAPKTRIFLGIGG